MARETPEAAAPATFLRGDEGASPRSTRARFERMIRRVQAEVCAALEAVEGGGALFREDAWTSPGGGGGISRVLQGGRVFEKAAVNVSVVYGVMPPEAYRAARPDAAGAGAAAGGAEKAGPVPFFAAGVSSVIHPINPFAPTMHFNYRYFETEAPEDAPGAPRQWWFGGGTDLTPSYIIEEDVKHFHSVHRKICDRFYPGFYPKFKKWCDDYFYIKHRGERRGVGGIFFMILTTMIKKRFFTSFLQPVLSVLIRVVPTETPFFHIFRVCRLSPPCVRPHCRASQRHPVYRGPQDVAAATERSLCRVQPLSMIKEPHLASRLEDRLRVY